MGRPFNAGEPLAYFITWTTYGTWLPGDDRGWHRRGMGEQPPSHVFVEMAMAKMREAPFLLSCTDREVVEDTIVKHCEIRHWQLHAASVRSNHVHVVVSALGVHAPAVRDQFKSWCTRNLKLNHPDRERFWTEGASCRWINHDDDLQSAVVYTSEAQDRKGRDRA